jgi:hypothetical protein
MACTRTGNLGLEKKCTCTFTDCANWGKCCSCIMNHRTKGEIPGCFFTAEAEKAGNRSVDYFIQNVGIPRKGRH